MMTNRSSADISVTASTAQMVDVTDEEETGRSFSPCCRNIKVFTFILSVLACVNGAIAASYLPSIISTMEQKFQFDSEMSGLIVSSYEIGATISAVLVSYFGHHGHIPMIIGWGCVIIGVGSTLFSLPHFIAPSYSEELIVQGDYSSNATVDDTLYCNINPDMTTTSPMCAKNGRSGNNLYIAIFIIAQILIGVGSSPILTIGLSYIDNFASRKSSTEYIAIVYAASILGSVLGFGGGAAMLVVYVDFFTHKPVSLGLSSSDDGWMGAWWGGFVVFAVLVFLIAPWFCMFPKSMSQADVYQSKTDINQETNDNAEVNPSTGLTSGKLSEMPRSLLQLLKNPVFMLINFGSVFEMIIVTGFLTFAAKYLETQFNLNKSSASLITGGVAVPSAVLGIIFMGILIKKFKMGQLGAIKSVVVLHIIAIFGFGISIILGCDNANIAGITIPYPDGIESQEIMTSKINGSKTFNLTHECNAICNCDNSIFKPVCHSDKEITYASFCHAGCAAGRVANVDECSCVPSYDYPVNSTVERTFIDGSCRTEICHLLPAYLVVLALVCCSIAAIKGPIALITLRCVSNELKSFGLGIQVVIIRLLALLPAPIIYGKIIDSTCLLWNTDCDRQLNCLIYSNSKSRYTVQGISLGFHLFGTLMFVIAWLLIRRDSKNFDDSGKSSDNTSENEVYVTHM